MDINVSCQGDLSESHCSAEGQFSFNPFLLRRTVSLKRDGDTPRYLKKWMKASDSMENGAGGLRLRLNPPLQKRDTVVLNLPVDTDFHRYGVPGEHIHRTMFLRSTGRDACVTNDGAGGLRLRLNPTLQKKDRVVLNQPVDTDFIGMEYRGDTPTVE